MTKPEAQSVAKPSSSASTNREGFPLHNAPDTSTFTSTTSFTRAQLRPGGLYFGANLVHAKRFTRHGTNLVQRLLQFPPGVSAAHNVASNFNFTFCIFNLLLSGFLFIRVYREGLKPRLQTGPRFVATIVNF